MQQTKEITVKLTVDQAIALLRSTKEKPAFTSDIEDATLAIREALQLEGSVIEAEAAYCAFRKLPLVRPTPAR